jgi:hypothetical protein
MTGQEGVPTIAVRDWRFAVRTSGAACGAGFAALAASDFNLGAGRWKLEAGSW